MGKTLTEIAQILKDTDKKVHRGKREGYPDTAQPFFLPPLHIDELTDDGDHIRRHTGIRAKKKIMNGPEAVGKEFSNQHSFSVLLLIGRKNRTHRESAYQLCQNVPKIHS